MQRLRTLIILIILSLITSFSGIVYADPAQQPPTPHIGIADEGELSALEFLGEETDQTPDAVHDYAKNHPLNNGGKVHVLPIIDGEHEGKFVVHFTEGSFIVTPDGGAKKITSAEHIKTIKTFVAPSSLGIRRRYNAALIKMAKEIEKIGVENITEEQAREFHKRRRELGKQLKNESGFLNEMGIYARNLIGEGYSDKLGPSYESLVKKGRSPAGIAVGSVTSGGGFTFLGFTIFKLEDNKNAPVIKGLKEQLRSTTKNTANAPPAAARDNRRTSSPPPPSAAAGDNSWFSEKQTAKTDNSKAVVPWTDNKTQSTRADQPQSTWADKPTVKMIAPPPPAGKKATLENKFKKDGASQGWFDTSYKGIKKYYNDWFKTSPGRNTKREISLNQLGVFA